MEAQGLPARDDLCLPGPQGPAAARVSWGEGAVIGWEGLEEDMRREALIW